jgi:CRISPR-associated protein Cas1
MDIGYTYLFYFIEANLNLYWFDTYKGVFHTQFFERKSLVCDLQEPFRPIIDRKIKNAFALNQIYEKDFKQRKWVYYLKFDKQSHYSALFLKELLEYKETIFKYVRDYYLSVIKEQKDLSSFEI